MLINTKFEMVCELTQAGRVISFDKMIIEEINE